MLLLLLPILFLDVFDQRDFDIFAFIELSVRLRDVIISIRPS